MTPTWSTPDDVAAKVRRRWDSGSLLRGFADGLDFEAIVVPLRGPTASQIGDDVAAALRWVRSLDTGSRDDRRYRLEWRSIGGRQLGRNQIPSHAVIESYEQAWALLGVGREVEQFDALVQLSADRPAVREWVVGHPLRALELAAEMPRVIAAYDWLDAQRDSARYLREITAPGVDTKFAERHRPVLAAMLGVSAASTGFLSDLGLRSKPELVRLRPSPSLGLLRTPLSEIAVRADELAQVDLAPTKAFVVENEITYLSVPVPDGGLVLWGKGFEVDRVGRLPWLAGTDVYYWGDIDTHGFAILDRLRRWLPNVTSVMMDRATLLAHRDRWVIEERPATSNLTHLSAVEHDLYTDLVGDVFGDRVRLEQERIDWAWAEEHWAKAGTY